MCSYVMSGMDVIRTIEAAGSLKHGKPIKEVIIQDCGGYFYFLSKFFHYY